MIDFGQIRFRKNLSNMWLDKIFKDNINIMIEKLSEKRLEKIEEIISKSAAKQQDIGGAGVWC